MKVVEALRNVQRTQGNEKSLKASLIDLDLLEFDQSQLFVWPESKIPYKITEHEVSRRSD